MNKGYFDKNDADWIIPLKDKHRKYLNLQKGKIHIARDKLSPRKTHQFVVEKVVWAQQSNDVKKIIVLEEFLWSDGRMEFRLAYYSTSKSGHWWWGRFATMIPKKDFEELLTYAKEKQLLSC